LCISSRLSASFIKIPFVAPSPVPTKIAVGVASPKAHGQATIKTATKFTKTISNWLLVTIKNQIIPVIIASKITICTNTPATLSASLWIGGLEACVFSISVIIFPRNEFSPSAVTLNSSDPYRFIVPPVTLSPIVLSVGRLSPVIIDSSILDIPSTILPSAGILSPGFKTTLLPIFKFFEFILF